MAAWAATAALCCCLALTPAPLGAQDPAALRARGFELAYNLDHDQATAMFRQAIAADPSHPAGYRSLAAVTWLNLLFQRGSVTSDSYLGSVVRPSIPLKKLPESQTALFHENAQRALSLAEARVRQQPKNADAHYQLGTTVGLLASYTATMEGRVLGAFRAARRAYNEHEGVLSLDPRRKDAALIVGTYRYIVAALSVPVRWMAYLVGFGGGRELGVRMVEEAAAYPSDAQTDARFALILLYNREKRYDDALRVLADLQRSYPRNRLLWLEAGGTALRAGRAEEAESWLNAGLARLERDDRPRAFGEAALWMYKRGAARILLGRLDEAQRDLRTALAAEAPDWVRGRVHTEQGKLADLAGDRRRARSEYATAARLCQQDTDPIGAAEARRLHETAYRR